MLFFIDCTVCPQDARHPVDEGFVAQLSWTVYGLGIVSSTRSLSGYLDTYHLTLTVRNTGVDPLTGLVIQASQTSVTSALVETQLLCCKFCKLAAEIVNITCF